MQPAEQYNPYQTLLDVSKSIQAHQDLRALFRDLSGHLHKVVRFDFLTLVLHNPARDTMRLEILESIEPPTQPSLGEIPVGESPAGWVFVHQTPLVIADIAAETRWPWLIEFIRSAGVCSLCYVPLTTAQRRLGTLGFGYFNQAQISREDVSLMQQVAAQAAVAVDNALSQQQLAHERDRLRVLLEITNALVAKLDTRELFRTIVSCLRQVVPHEYTSLALRRPDSEEFVLHALEFTEGSGRIREDQSGPITGSPAGVAYNTRRPQRYLREDLEKFPSEFSGLLVAEGIQTLCSFPLVARAYVLGTLNVGSLQPNAFSEDDMLLLEPVAGQIAIALENAFAYHEIAELKDKLATEKLYLEDEIRTEGRFGEMVGESAAFRHILQQVETVAPTGASVLILGETGTGKELIARAIHDLSPRSSRTFVKLNCAAIPTGLLESELFGHERGAFTGAISQKIGRFELAHGGSLFLDEVGDIPLELQPKLLRALQEHEFERLGSTRTVRVDVRLIAATNRDLGRMINDREFRSDLYYRLNVFPILIPPLRDRRDDIPMLVRYFTQKFGRRMGRHVEEIPAETMAWLTEYHWPGNIRELENLIERAVILSPGTILHVPLAELREAVEAAPASAEAANATLEAAERKHILRVLEQTGWRVGGPAGAAAKLGLKRTTLQSRMKKLGISRNE